MKTRQQLNDEIALFLGYGSVCLDTVVIYYDHAYLKTSDYYAKGNHQEFFEDCIASEHEAIEIGIKRIFEITRNIK